MEDGTVAREKRSSKGEFVHIDESNEDRSDGSSGEKEVQEFEITFNKESDLNKSQASCFPNHNSLSNRQQKKRLYRQALGFVLDLKPDLQMANIAKGIYLGKYNIESILSCFHLGGGSLIFIKINII